jgi:hypothetical protein
MNRRVFSTNQDTNFRDYIDNKKGQTIIKDAKSVSNKLPFLSYYDFTILAKTFSKNANIMNVDVHSFSSMNDKTTGLIYYEKIVSHIDECNFCRDNVNANGYNLLDLLKCENIKNIIYAYENNFTNTKTNVLQKNIDLCRWCKPCENSFIIQKECESDYEKDSDCHTESDEEEPKPKPTPNKLCRCKPHNKNTSSTGRRPIFCSQCNKYIDICVCPKRWGRVEAIKHVNHKL